MMSPRLQFLRARQLVELAPADAERIGVLDGDAVEVTHDGASVRGTARLRAAIPPGSVFVVEGTTEEPANRLTGVLVSVAPARVPAGAGVEDGA